MIYKKLSIISILIISMFFIIPTKLAFGDSLNKILIVYDSYNVYGNNFNVLGTVNRIATESNKSTKVESIGEVEKDNYRSLDNYEKVIFINCNTEKLPEKFVDALNYVSNKLIYISNIKEVGLRYSQYFSINNLSNNLKETRRDLLKDITNNKFESNRYLMINNVNPFIDLNGLVDKIQFLNQHGIPFILNTIPVFENPNSNGMKNFTEVLRYAQASGGYIVLSCPYIQNSVATSQEIFSAMEESYKNYIKYLVYPIAISMPNYLLYREDMKNYLEQSNTIFIENTSVGMLNLQNYSNPTFKNVITEIPYGSESLNYINNYYGSTAITIPNSENLKEFESTVDTLINGNILFESPRVLNSSINIKGEEVECKNQGVYLNNKYVQQDEYIPNKELMEKTKPTTNVDKNNINISKITDKLMIFALIACGIFIVITIISKRIDRKKFFK